MKNAWGVTSGDDLKGAANGQSDLCGWCGLFKGMVHSSFSFPCACCRYSYVKLTFFCGKELQLSKHQIAVNTYSSTFKWEVADPAITVLITIQKWIQKSGLNCLLPDVLLIFIF